MTSTEADLRRQDNARLFISIAALVVVLAIALGVTAFRYRTMARDTQVNQDGIACILERQPDPLRPPTGACERFLKEM